MKKEEIKGPWKFKSLQAIIQGILILATGLVTLYFYIMTGTNLLIVLVLLAGGMVSIWFGKKFFEAGD